MAVFDDDFSSYSPGHDPPSGFIDDGFFPGQVVALSAYQGKTGNAYQFNGAGGQILWPAFGIFSQSTTIVWEMNTEQGQNTFPQVTVGNGSGTSIGQTLCFTQVENDKSVSIYMEGGTIGGPNQAILLSNSFEQVAWANTWAYAQLNVFLFPVPVGTSTYVGVTANLWWDGVYVCSGTNVSNILVSSLPSATAVVNEWLFSCENAGYLGYIYADTVLETGGFFPHPGSPRLARVTQSVLEMSRRPAIRNARVPQGVVEITRVPSIRRARIAQGVVEIIKRGGAGGEWIVYEA